MEDGRLTKVEGNSDLFSEGTLCSRAFAIPQELFNPTRVRYPQRRVGEKGSGQWKRISWEEAYKEAAERFTKIGEEHGWRTIAHQYGTGREIDADFARELSEEFSFESPRWGFGTGPRRPPRWAGIPR